MDARKLLEELLAAKSLKDLDEIVDRELDAKNLTLTPVGGRPNNRGAIEVATDASRSLIERVTNAHDGLLELEHQKHQGTPTCASPREAASAWLGVPAGKGLSGLSIKERQDLAAKVVLTLDPGDGSQARIITVQDQGVGILPEKMSSTILSINESNKIDKHYLAGTYGQGGSSTFAFSRASLIVSRKFGQEKIGFTVVRYEELPADKFKTGRYVYLCDKEAVLFADAQPGDMEHGTIVRHFGYDLSSYAGSIGPKSLYGALQRVLFDPVAPVRLENRVHGWNRVIKGSRNALNGAVDQGEDSKGPDLDHSIPVFNVALGDFGKIGIEYWLLKRSEDKGKKAPSDSFVDARRPIVLTHNGQNQGEIAAALIKKSADLPYLRSRLICHINCDGLSPAAKRQLFASTREQSREGYLLTRIEEELVSILKADDELRRLNDLARDQNLEDQDAAAEAQMKKQVARLLRISGAALAEVGGAKKSSGSDGKPSTPKNKKTVEPITLSEPPTYINLVWEEEAPIPFFAGQRRYLRIETDANSDYHDPSDAKKSRINVAVPEHMQVFGTTPLTAGRMRVGVEAKSDVTLGQAGSIRVELYRTGLATLGAERQTVVVEPPKPKDQGKGAPVPDFRIVAVDGPDDPNWENIAEAGEGDITTHASNAVENGGLLMIYYSTAFPRFSTELKRFAMADEAQAKSFKKRYELWIAVHSLLIYQADQERDENSTMDDELQAKLEREERCRLAIMATMIASQEVKNGISSDEDDAEAA